MTARRLDSQEVQPPTATHQELLARLADSRWYSALGAAGVTALFLGFWGYWSSGDGSHSASDAVYGSIKLFFWGATLPPDAHVGFSLNAARFLAPLVAGWATSIALVSRVVVIEADGANPQVATCRGWGVPTIIGDAQQKSTLEAVGVKRAARLLAVTPDNVVNTEIVTRARLLAGQRRVEPNRLRHVRNTSSRPGLRCLARIVDPGLCVLLRTAEANRGDDESTLDFFNTDEIGARMLLERYPIDTACQPHILVAHLGALGVGLVFHAARKWHDERGDSAARQYQDSGDQDIAWNVVQRSGGLYRAEYHHGPFVHQAAAAFPPETNQSVTFVARSADQWRSCAGQIATVTYPDHLEYTWRIGDPSGDAPMITLTYTQQNNDALQPTDGYGCQRALRAVSNIVIDVKACAHGVTNEAIRIADRMTANVTHAKTG